jgi:iron complex transport system substrate-binding protein
MPHPRRAALALAAASAVLLAAACSTGPSSGSAPAATQTAAATGTDAGAFPVTIQHAFGATTINAEPKRIATVGWSDADAVVALGVLPIGAPKITWGGNAAGSTDWFDAGVAKIGSGASITRYDDTAGVPIDQIAALGPDLILGVNSGLSREEYDKLVKIAPVVAYPGAAWGTSWEDSLATIGKALGRNTAAAQLRTATDRTIDDGVAKHQQVKGKAAAWAWFTPTDLSTIGLYTSSDLRPQMLRRFGMVDAPVVTQLSQGNNQFSANLSAEKASTLTADALVFYVESPDQVAQLKAHPLLGQIPALQSNQYVASADNAIALTMSSPSPLSIPVAVEKFLPKLASAVNGTPAQ